MSLKFRAPPPPRSRGAMTCGWWAAGALVFGCTIEPVPRPVDPNADASADAAQDVEEDAPVVFWPPRTCEEQALLPHTSCGGDPAGTWEIVSYCDDIASLDPRNIVSVCGSDVTVTGERSAQGELEISRFGDWRLTLRDRQGEIRIDWALRCIDDRDAQARSVCTGSNFNGECDIVLDRCICTSRLENPRFVEAGQWTAQSSVLSVLNLSEFAFEHTYCVRNDTLDMRRLARPGVEGWRLVARRVPAESTNR
jgi:hypothetical protein